MRTVQEEPRDRTDGERTQGEGTTDGTAMTIFAAFISGFIVALALVVFVAWYAVRTIGEKN